MLSYKIAIFSRDKIKTYKETWSHPYERERVVNNHFYHMVHRKEEGTYHCIEKLMKEMPGFLSLPLLLIPWINKEQRISDRSKTAHREPPVKCTLTGLFSKNWFFLLFSKGFPGESDSKETACNAGDLGSIPGLGRSPGEGNGYSLQYSCLENSMDRGVWWATVHGVAKSKMWLSA